MMSFFVFRIDIQSLPIHMQCMENREFLLYPMKSGKIYPQVTSSPNQG